MGERRPPLRRDVPEWEAARVRAVLDPKLHLGAADVRGIDGTADSPVPDLPDAVSPAALAVGPRFAEPMVEPPPASAGPPPSADDVVAYARARLAPYKVPKTVELVDAIARSEATKVNRRALVDARGS